MCDYAFCHIILLNVLVRTEFTLELVKGALKLSVQALHQHKGKQF